MATPAALHPAAHVVELGPGLRVLGQLLGLVRRLTDGLLALRAVRELHDLVEQRRHDATPSRVARTRCGLRPPFNGASRRAVPRGEPVSRTPPPSAPGRRRNPRRAGAPRPARPPAAARATGPRRGRRAPRRRPRTRCAPARTAPAAPARRPATAAPARPARHRR